MALLDELDFLYNGDAIGGAPRRATVTDNRWVTGPFR